ncbi:phosphoethanolamine N-methyltransferase-like, partial [Lingula anatina]|uniref:phosphoethanolamine N-methyltransferase n=1 Tax=Lingula anatina TaxID=7574 RepID=A0A1S3IUU5_LINAN
MSKYWRQHSSEGNLQEMLLDNDAEDIAREETPEILSMLPDYENKDVIELGAGIGRFTSSLSEQSKSVVAVDFMQNFIEKNKETNDHYGNTEFICADVTHLDLPASSADIVFSNWLLMYLSNDEIVNLGRKMLSWLRNDGYFFFRESCFHKSGSKARENDFNPTQYRNPAEYVSLLERAVLPAENGNGSYAFEMVLSKNVQTYLKMKQNKNQVCWLLKKVRVDTVHNHGYKTFQEFLDTQQYSRNKILTYEKIFGRHFISTGGKETTEEFCKMLDLQPGQKVLDVGCGIGGGAFHMAQRYDVSVLGVDLSENAVSIAWERCLEFMDSRVEFEVADATKRDYPAESFDVVYSRDTILHIDDKLALFKKFY